MFQYNKLRGKIVEVFGSISKFSEKLSISEVSVSKKLNCKSGFSQKDIIEWSNLLGISSDDYAEYFFK